MRLEINTLTELKKYLDAGPITGSILRNINITDEELKHPEKLKQCILLGCTIPNSAYPVLLNQQALIFPSVPDLPFSPFRGSLYTPEELLNGYNPKHPSTFETDSTDALIYQYYKNHPNDLTFSSLLQRIHDSSIDDAIEALLNINSRKLKTVGIMGGHSLKRTDSSYWIVVKLAHQLTQAGYFIATGGGPGAMEAGNLGAYLSFSSAAELEDIIEEIKPILCEFPSYKDLGWIRSALEVRARFPSQIESLGIPTWFYGHEPSNLFASHVGKYFANSIREDGLLTIAVGGIVYAPGSAGTIQEIFQDACQNHYASVKHVSSMIFLDTHYWTQEKPVYPLLKNLAAGRGYEQMIGIFDDADSIADFIRTHPPILE